MFNLQNAVLSGGVAIALSVLFLVSLIVFVIAYVVMRMRDARNEQHDPQLGTKSALHLFSSVAVLLMLSGFTMVVEDLLNKDAQKRLKEATEIEAPPGFERPKKKTDDSMSATQRAGWSMFISGLLFLLVHWVMVKLATNDSRWPVPRRLFAGYRFLLHGVVVVTVTTLFILFLFREDPLKEVNEMEAGKLKERMEKQINARTDMERNSYLTVLFIWGPSWLAHLILLCWYSTQPDVPSGRDRDRDD